jgi:asparagine N-glycosylation enzyme membrane subunit Stt3
MSSRQNRDEIDLFEDTTHENETLFIPVAESAPDSWTAFYSGILIGIAGGALAALAPWLSGLLILAGYGLTVSTLKNTGNRFIRALRFGFAIAALSGAVLLAGDVFFPKAVWHFLEAAGTRSPIFLSVLAAPWLLALIRYAYALARGEKRCAAVRRR